MNISSLRKVAAVVFTVLLSYFVTSSLASQKGKPRTAQPAPQKNVPPVVTAQTEVHQGNVDLFKPARTDNSMIASDAMKEYSVEPLGNSVHIKATAYIYDTRDYSYVWHVRIVNTVTSQVVYFRSYAEQMFQLPDNNLMEPTFEDLIIEDLPTGTYAVETSIFKVTPEYGLDAQNVPTLAESLRSPRGVRTVSLQK